MYSVGFHFKDFYIKIVWLYKPKLESICPLGREPTRRLHVLCNKQPLVLSIWKQLSIRDSGYTSMMGWLCIGFISVISLGSPGWRSSLCLQCFGKIVVNYGLTCKVVTRTIHLAKQGNFSFLEQHYSSTHSGHQGLGLVIADDIEYHNYWWNRQWYHILTWLHWKEGEDRGDGLAGKLLAGQATTSWVLIPSCHGKSWACLFAPVTPALGMRQWED